MVGGETVFYAPGLEVAELQGGLLQAVVQQLFLVGELPLVQIHYTLVVFLG